MSNLVLVELENTRDKVIGVNTLLESINLSEILDDKYSCAFDILQDNLDSIKYDLSKIIENLSEK